MEWLDVNNVQIVKHRTQGEGARASLFHGCKWLAKGTQYGSEYMCGRYVWSDHWSDGSFTGKYIASTRRGTGVMVIQ